MEEAAAAEHSPELYQGAQEALDHLSLAEAPLLPRVAAAGRPASRSTYPMNFSLASCTVTRTSSFRASRLGAAVPGLSPPFDDRQSPLAAPILVQNAIHVFQRNFCWTG